jgi:hypothetical protein
MLTFSSKVDTFDYSEAKLGFGTLSLRKTKGSTRLDYIPLGVEHCELSMQGQISRVVDSFLQANEGIVRNTTRATVSPSRSACWVDIVGLLHNGVRLKYDVLRVRLEYDNENRMYSLYAIASHCSFFKDSRRLSTAINIAASKVVMSEEEKSEVEAKEKLDKENFDARCILVLIVVVVLIIWISQ